MVSAAVLKCNGLQFESSLARVLRQRQYTLEGEAWYVNVQGSVHWGCAAFFVFVIETDQLEMTQSHMFNTSLKLIYHKCLMRK